MSQKVSTAKIDQKEYLKKYLSGDKSKKKKKKKDKDKEKSKLKKLRIIDDDASAFQRNGNSDEEMLLYGEDAPQIVGEYVETKPNGDADKWRSIAVKEEVHIKQETDEDRWGKRANERNKNELAKAVKRENTPDISPPRKRDRRSGERNGKAVALDQSPKRQRRHKMSNDFSPPRNRKNGVSPRRRRSDERQLSRDLSPTRKYKNSISPHRRHASIEQSLPRRRHDVSDQTRQKRKISTDLSPARRRKSSISPHRRDGYKDQSPPRRREGTSDQSPPRRRRNSIDSSPLRQQSRQKKQFSRDLSPARKQKNNTSPRRFDEFADQSPPRRHRVSTEQSPQRRRQLTPPRQQQNRFSLTLSPLSKGRYGSAEHSPPGRNNNLIHRTQKETRRNSPGLSSPNRKRRDLVDMSPKRRGFSPQRQTEYSRTERQSPSRYRQRSRSFERARNNNAWNSTAQRQGSYVNPFAQKGIPHQKEYNSPEKRQMVQQEKRNDFFRKPSSSLERNRNNSGSNRRDLPALRRELLDPSPLRRRQRSPRQENRRVSPAVTHTNPCTRSAERLPIPPPKVTIHWETAAMVAQRKARRSPSASPPPTHKPKASKTLDGKKAGLQDARALKEETAARRRDEDKMFAKMSSELSGRDAEVQVRNTGRRGRRARDAKAEDPEKQRHKEEREQKRKEQYDRWGKGLKQVEDHRARLAEQEYESSKPLARYADDEDLDRHLREQERAEDPMLDYMRRKKRETDKKTNSKSKVPVYEGSYPENRFGIRPGHRWDGVDRSNGYEKKWFDVQNEKRAVQEDAYKYSVEDM